MIPVRRYYRVGAADLLDRVSAPPLVALRCRGGLELGPALLALGMDADRRRKEITGAAEALSEEKAVESSQPSVMAESTSWTTCVSLGLTARKRKCLIG